MKIRVTATTILSNLWASEEQLSSLEDDEIIALVGEDLTEFINEASWRVERIPDDKDCTSTD